MADNLDLSNLFRSVGRYSRYAGLGFVALSVAFLILAVYDQFIVFEIDSIVAFAAAIFLLFRDPRARVQAGVLDAIMISSDRSIMELTASSSAGFTYVPTGSSLDDVAVVPGDFEETAMLSDGPLGSPALIFTPPGLGLARLYKRETGLSQVTMEALVASLSETMRESFGLARSVDIESKDESAKITLHGSSVTCSCADRPVQTGKGGSIGCTVASFLAVLITTATKRSVSLERCVHNDAAGEWIVSMKLGPNIMVSQ